MIQNERKEEIQALDKINIGTILGVRLSEIIPSIGCLVAFSVIHITKIVSLSSGTILGFLTVSYIFSISLFKLLFGFAFKL